MKKTLLLNYFKAATSRNPRKNTTRFNGLLALFVMVMGMEVSWGQTNPAAFALSGGSFTFTTQTASSTSYPTNIQGWNNGGTNNLSTLSTAASTANVSLTASASASTAGLGNLGASGFQFLTTGSVQTVGALAIALNATGRNNILVTWTAADQTNAAGRQTNLTLQYRVGTSGSFITVASSTYTTNTGGVAGTQAASTFSNIPLPSDCDGQSVVQIRWLYFESASQSGSRDAIRLDEITVSSSPSISTTNYYSKSTGNLNDVANWGTNTDGTGTAPSDFTTAGQVFNIRNNATPTIGAAWTVSGSGSKIVIGDGTNACNFTIPADFAVTGTVDVSAGATLTNTNTSIPTLGTLAATSTVVFNAAGSQTVPIATYGNLSISNTGSSTATAAGAITVTNGLTVSSGSTFDMSTFALSGAALTTSGTGTLKTQNTTSTPLPTGRTWSLDVQYNSSSGQTVIAGSYANLNLTGGNRTLIASGTINISGTYTPGAGTLIVTDNTINFNGADGQTIPAATYNSITSSNNTRTLANGVIKIASTFTPGTSNYTIGTSTVEFSGSSVQTIPVLPVASGGNYYNLTYSGTSTGTLNGSMTVDNNVTLSGGTINITNTTSKTLTVNGNLNISGGSIDFAGSGATVSGVISIKGNLTQTSGGSTTTEAIANGLITFSGSGTILAPQTLSLATTSALDYTNITVNSGTVVKLLSNILLRRASSAIYKGTFTVSGGLDCDTFTYNGGINSTTSGTQAIFTINSGATLVISNSAGINSSIGTTNLTRTFNAGANYIFNSATTTAFPTTAQQSTFGDPANIDVNANITLGRDITVTGTLTQTSAAKLTIGAFTLTLNGGYSGGIANSIKGSASSNLTTTGTTGTLFFDQTTPGSTNVLKNLTLSSGTATLGNVLNITAGASSGIVTVGSGATLNTGGFLTLKSDANGTAQVAEIGSGGTITGNVTVERYLPARRAWRLLTAPLKGNTNNSIYANWQGVNDEGVLLWGPNGNGTNGLSVGPQANIWSYSNGWNAVSNTNSSLLFSTRNNAFLVYATGPSNSTNIASNTGASITTLRPKGELITGTVNYTGLTAGQFHLLGNPYASPIDVARLRTSNASYTFYLLDPSLGDANSRGGYYTYNGSWAPNTPSNALIQSGQGFFVKSASATTFDVAESHKDSGNSNMWFDRTTADTSVDKIRVLLYKQDNSAWYLADGILAVNSASGNHEVDAADADKMTNFNENLLFKNGTSNLAIEYRGLPAAGTLQPMQLTGTSAQPYELRIKTENYSNSNLTPYLENTQTGVLTAIPTDGSEVIVPFTGIAATSAAPDSRFRIVYQAPLSADDLNNLVVGVYPNPVHESLFTIELANTNAPARYSLTNLLGQVVQEGSLVSLTNAIPVHDLSEGMYLLQINQEGKRFTTKLMIK